MPKRFADRVDPWCLLDREQVIEGEFELASLDRLSSLSLNNAEQEQVSFSLAFSRDQDRRAIVQCDIRATLALVCQRCMDSMSLPVEIKSRLAIVRGPEEAEGLPEALDPLLLATDGLLNIRELVEDELLLAIPDVPKHDDEACELVLDAYMEEAPMEQERSEPNPFDILAVLKKT